MINLFEYQNKELFKGSLQSLESFLDDIWNRRDKSGFYLDTDDDKREVQQFLQFIHKTNELKSNKYVGVIYFGDYKINLLPKIFFDKEKEFFPSDINAIHNHILWWLSYCRRIKFPNYQASISSLKSDFFEVLIFLYAKYTRELLSNTIYQQYEDNEKELSFIKGRINTNSYINEDISKGRWHKVNCSFDSFEIDNKFNRIIKYVTSLLFHVSKNYENKKYLREILFILDEVSDVKVSAEDCINIRFNPMFGDFETVRDYCYLFLNNCISYDYKNDLKLFAFLLPMDYVFEDFIFGFIDKEIKEIRAKSQVISKYLDQKENFTLRPDLVLQLGSRKIIADTKYKIIYSDKNDLTSGISQSDLYQMLAYGVRFRINEIKLFYPETINNSILDCKEINIKDEFAKDIDINIRAYQLPIINKEPFNQTQTEEVKLSELFEENKVKLANRIKEILVTTELPKNI